MKIEILGTGCKKCKQLHKAAIEAVEAKGIEAEIVKVEDMKDIMAYGVMSTPALVIDGKVVSSGKVLKSKQIVDML
ncbi:TM0996/MTH895 family glutaredoxin-like protein [Clostridia bacterium]|nr:TM0996/MTH895 family glutaredoxin-like protein [Clostridia bacterium]